MVKITQEELREYGRKEKKEFLKRWGYWPCSIVEFNNVSLYCVKIYFNDKGTKEIVSFLKKFEMDYEIEEIEKNFVHFHCLYNSVDDKGIEILEFDISNRIEKRETHSVHWLG